MCWKSRQNDTNHCDHPERRSQSRHPGCGVVLKDAEDVGTAQVLGPWRSQIEEGRVKRLPTSLRVCEREATPLKRFEVLATADAERDTL